MSLTRSPLKRTAPKRKKRSPMKSADELFSKLVRERDGCCLRCGSSDRLQAAHIWSRRYRALRWRLENCITLDAGCHFYMTTHPAEFGAWCDARRFCELGICFGPDGEHHEQHEDFAAYSYSSLRWRALNEPPEKPRDALLRLRATTQETT